ncbi:MAG: exodeoxyribonuclease VII small subunit [Bacteroidales bacterium]|nr:exodeoxyribonuclease VII small subunit [Bacteroidales bacterium]
MENFDYTAAMAELEELAVRVEDPQTPLDDIDRCLKRASELSAACRNYLRTTREELERLEK